MRISAIVAAMMLLGLGLSGCASVGPDDSVVAAGALPREDGHAQSQAGQTPLQCVPYAREHSQIKLFGDAYTWWDQAAGKYARGAQPTAGAVMVLFDYAGPDRGHLAVVRRLVSAREIRVDHANWLDDGAIYVNDPVVDVSAANDWSRVRVWNIKTGGWGTKIFPVQGFIAPADDRDGVVVARNGDGEMPPPPLAAIADSGVAQADPAPSSGHALSADDLAIP